MGGSLHIGTFAGIPVKIHWTFGLLLMYIVFDNSREGFEPVALLFIIGFVLTIFLCVVLHEFGHALVARKFGVKTFDIIMTPIGGIARLERMPEGKGQEFWVAIAGPFVNFIIFFLIWAGFYIISGTLWPNLSVGSWPGIDPVTGYFYLLMVANLALGAFNLIPAFPMDGGRILRSLLSLKMDRVKATQIASYAGQGIALIMFVYAVYHKQPVLTLIGVFIFFAARQENKMLRRQTLMSQTRASDLMDPIEHVLFTGQMMSTANELVKSLRGDSFIVWSRPGIPAGYITRDMLHHYPKSFQSEPVIDAYVIPSPAIVFSDTSADQLYAFMQRHKIQLALVSENNQYVGVVSWNKVLDLMRK